jgi:hypothetical protein
MNYARGAVCAAAVLGLLVAAGCYEKERPATAKRASASESEMPALCARCGQIKGSAACCKPGAEKCPKCGLDKGSPGCCRLPKK